MTNDYKNNILDYITNNVSQTSGSNEPLFNDSEILNISLTEQIKTALNINTFFYMGHIYDEQTQLILIYGIANGGFFYIIDKDLNEVAVLTEYDTGSTMFPINDLKRDETGNLYGVTSTNPKRVVLLNNVFAKKEGSPYKVILRQSYIIPNSEDYEYPTINNSLANSYASMKAGFIKKVPSEATYYIFLDKTSTHEGYVLRFTINVGSDNEWVFTNVGIEYCGADFLIEVENNTPKLWLFCTDQNTHTKSCYTFTIENDVCTQISRYTTDTDVLNVIAKSIQEQYVVCLGTLGNNSYLKKLSNGTFTNIQTFQYNERMLIQKGDNVIFLKFGNYLNGMKVGILQNDTPYYSTVSPAPAVLGTIAQMFILQSYNLIIIYSSTGDSNNQTITKYTLDYNPTNYNGLPYTDYNQTAISKGRLYSNNKLVFARNLYNLTLNGSTSTATLQIPNTLLNGITISQEKLVGETNTILVEQSESIQKNIYESVYLNYIQTLNVIDEDENTTYPLTAAYINQNINIGTQQNCEDTFAGKVVINYSNGQFTQGVLWNYNVDHYELSFIIDARTDSVESFNIVSNDESTIYITKDVDLQSGHYYQVNLKLRIE